MEIILYSVLFCAGFAVMAVFLPIKIFLNAAGGSDTGFNFEVRVLVFNGFLGGGLQSENQSYLFTFFVFSHGIFTVNATKLISFASRKIKTRTEKKEEKKIRKPPTKKKKWTYKLLFRLVRELFAFLKWVIREFHEMFRFDNVIANIKLGLGYPHILGWIIGFLYTLNGVLPEKFIIVPSWDFTRKVIQGDFSLRLTVRAYIFWMKLVTKAPYALYRQREQIKYWFKVLKQKNSIQEA